jgi:hypothetical protein
LFSHAFAWAGISLDRRRARAAAAANPGDGRSAAGCACCDCCYGDGDGGSADGAARARARTGKAGPVAQTRRQKIAALLLLAGLLHTPAFAQIAPFDDFKHTPEYYSAKAKAGDPQAMFYLGLAIEALGPDAARR